ncbi:acylphosphatase-2-like [Daphnia pulicaria]|uniref:acylphosphatase-2-like n=1 Tax=Daphnia pulicaria TaxID=35523 RepID=UPI001EEC5DE0|nr:acylphosphatase-2-like [Daphnia pulicaria]
MGQDGEVSNDQGGEVNPAAAGGVTFVSVEFEVYGHVQGCYFTKFCKDTADQLGLSGWVKNSKKGTIVGKVQGEKIRIDEMAQWLTRTGSPGCKIDHAELRNWEYLARPEFRGFSIRF